MHSLILRLISFVGGGAGAGAEAQAIIDENGTLTSVQITSPGVNYTSPPAVVISPSNGVLDCAQLLIPKFEIMPEIFRVRTGG